MKGTLKSGIEELKETYVTEENKEKLRIVAEKVGKSTELTAKAAGNAIAEGAAAFISPEGEGHIAYFEKRDENLNDIRGIWNKEAVRHEQFDGYAMRETAKTAAAATARFVIDMAEQSAEMAEKRPVVSSGSGRAYSSFDYDTTLEDIESDLALLDIELALAELDD